LLDEDGSDCIAADEKAPHLEQVAGHFFLGRFVDMRRDLLMSGNRPALATRYRSP